MAPRTAAFPVVHDPATGRFLPKGDAGGQPGDKDHAVGVTNDPRSLIQKASPQKPDESDTAYNDRVFREAQEHYPPVQTIELEAEDVRHELGLPDPQVKDWTSIEAPLERLKETAAAFEQAKSDPSDPRVVACYRELVAQTNTQWQHLTGPESEGDQGVKVEFLTQQQIRDRGLDPIGLNPYRSAEAQAADLRDNKHLMIASISDWPEAHHPLLSNELGGEYDTFRAVHDAYGHAAIGADFTRHGEFQAWLHHSSMFTGNARLAASTELTGENSYLIAHHGQPAPHKAVILPENLVAMPWDSSGQYNPHFWERAPGRITGSLDDNRWIEVFADDPAAAEQVVLLSDLVDYPVPDPATATGSDLALLDNGYAYHGVVNPNDALHGAILLQRIQRGDVDPATLQAAIAGDVTAPVARDDYGHAVVIQPGETWYSHPDGSISEDDGGSPSPGYVWVPDPVTGDETWRICPEHGPMCEDNGLEANCEHDDCGWRNRYTGYGLAPFEGNSLVSAAGDGIAGAMVAAVPSSSTAPAVDAAVALPHVTLCYLGKDATEIDDTTRALVDAFVAMVAADEEPVVATVAGAGVMGKDNAVVLLLNSTALYEAHEEIQAGLEEAGLCPPWSHDGFICHLSLEYPDDVGAAIVAAQSYVGSELVFDALITCYGGEEHHFPLGGEHDPSDVVDSTSVYYNRGVFRRRLGPGHGHFVRKV